MTSMRHAIVLGLLACGCVNNVETNLSVRHALPRSKSPIKLDIQTGSSAMVFRDIGTLLFQYTVTNEASEPIEFIPEYCRLNIFLSSGEKLRISEMGSVSGNYRPRGQRIGPGNTYESILRHNVFGRFVSSGSMIPYAYHYPDGSRRNYIIPGNYLVQLRYGSADSGINWVATSAKVAFKIVDNATAQKELESAQNHASHQGP